jgi:hypothetical protein
MKKGIRTDAFFFDLSPSTQQKRERRTLHGKLFPKFSVPANTAENGMKTLRFFVVSGEKFSVKMHQHQKDHLKP